MYKKATMLTLVAVLLAGTFTPDARSLSAKERDAQSQAQSIDEDTTETIDDMFASIALRVPGFGGMYVDEEKNILYVYLRDTNPEAAMAKHRDLEAVMTELRTIFSHEHLAQRSVQVLPARYGFLELKQWHDLMAKQVFELPEVTLTDIDDAKNRLTVGVENVEARAQVEKQLAGLGIPLEAVSIIETGPIELDTSLRDFHRPLVGGLQITFTRGTRFPRCTLGFIAVRAGVPGFVTNSHCSARRNAVDGTVYHQPTIVEIDNEVGIETVDPRGSRCVFFIFRCRRSDSNFSQIIDVANVPVKLGFIARPELGEVAWDGESTFMVVAEAVPPFVGLPVTKVGKTTGRTFGVVLLTGVTVPIPPITSRRLLRGQVVAAYERDDGDSGGPVILALPFDPPINPVPTSLVGIHWGGFNLPGPVDGAVFSPIRGVEADLGRLNTCAPPFVC